ncbi:protein VAPYRIN-like [Andrographis paniculata]|uniref:protein VAPYRIN-like n=1 Tax=Andrographis paniculata TaxID=175694 RepID=UPI0021E812FD|nr:protein VAPYRIN-like [Andrographis paniculata]
MDRLLTLDPSNVVPLRVEPGHRSAAGAVTLRNVMYTMPVAFRLLPADRNRYAVAPPSGIILPLKSITIEITYLDVSGGLPTTAPYCDDKFELQSVVAPAYEAAGAAAPPPPEWFTNKKKQVYSDLGIRVFFVGSVVLVKLVTAGRMEEVREVLERSDAAWRSADAAADGGGRRRLLHLAIEQGRADLVQLLLEFDADVEGNGRSGLSPLEAAVAAGEGLIVELLLAKGASPARAVYMAARGGDAEVLGLLLVKGGSADAAVDGEAPLHAAVAGRRRDCVRLLLGNGAKADAQSARDGETPLHVAARIGDEQMVRMLLSKGGDKYVINKAGRTAYDVAAENGHARLFDALKLGDRLCAAARRGDVRVLGRVLDGGASINGRDQNGWTALHRAAFKGRVAAARALIDRGIEVDARDREGYTALHCAVEAGQAEVAELLVKKGADVAAATAKGATAVGMAEAMEYKGIVRILEQGVKEGFDGGDTAERKVERRRLRRRSFGQSTPLAVV